MTDKEQQKAAKAFAAYWKGKGDEKGESQKFWLSLLRDVYGIEHPEDYISFEDRVFLGHTSFIDGYIADTKVLIEQKALGKDLKKPIKQSDGTMLNPFQQAKRYITELPVSKHPRWVITCNFSNFLVYDMDNPKGEPEEILLENFEKDYYRLSFLVDNKNVHLQREMELSIQAGEIVGLLYDAFLKQYKDPTNEHSLRSLNMLCVRLVFCLYAENAGIFGTHSMFHDYMADYRVKDMRDAIIKLFRILDTKPEDREGYDDELEAFPYVNGNLFSDENIEIPKFTEEIRDLLLNKASNGFNWSEISPTIFGAVFESTLNPETRRSGGMHYTSIENIHKVIDPLFLDDLKKEFAEIKEIKTVKTKEAKLRDFQHKIAGLKFLDPACGSGNFLTETYISLRRLENEVISTLHNGQIIMGLLNPIKVSIGQFYGIEINDFAVSVAKTALWIAESQMMKETEDIVHQNLDFLPLKSYANIVEGNALRVDWESVVPKTELNYIMDNPPFVGSARLNNEQKQDREFLFNNKGGDLDYVSCWYKKAGDFIENLHIRCAFVSTNSICQGQQVYPLWSTLIDSGIKIDFAYTTFRWDSEANDMAHVYCVIIGFSRTYTKIKYIYDNGMVTQVDNINGYLIAAPNIFIEKRRIPLCDVPIVIKGFQPTDNGYLILNDDEKNSIISAEPETQKWIRPFITAKEFLHGKNRWCLWLKGITPKEINTLKEIKKRVSLCQEWRSSQKETGDAYKLKDIPTLMRPSSKFKEGSFIILPRHSGEKRRYIPFGFSNDGSIPGDSISIASNATIYHFGILCSNVHMAWTRTVCGRLEMRYRYTSDIVYNNFPWCSPTPEQKSKIEKTAQAILDARALYPDSSLADLYDELTMPPELRKAHQNNDRAVMVAYGFSTKMTESECVAELMKMYQKFVSEK